MRIPDLVLRVLWEGDGQTITEIANQLAQESRTYTPLAKRLEQARFLSNPAA